MEVWNYANLWEAVAAATPDRPALIHGERVIEWGAFDRRANALARGLVAAGLSHQSKVAAYLYNAPEYIETYFAAFKAGLVPFNTNYRYSGDELVYLFDNADAEAVVFHASFAETAGSVRARLPKVKIWVAVPEEGHAIPDWAVSYDDLAAGDGAPFQAPWGRSADDLLFMYTGGTTGMPKGVMWRQADIYVSSLGGRPFGAPEEWESVDALVAAAAAANPTKTVPAPPFMHGAAHWAAFTAFSNGGTVVVTDVVDRFDAPSVVDLLAREQANVLLLVGDAFARPLLDAVDASAASGKPADLSALFVLTSGGAILSAPIKERLLESLPNIMLIDGLGSSETGTQAGQVSSAGGDVSTGRFSPHPGMVVLNEDLTRVLEPGDDEMGWLGQRNRVPLGYLGDEAKTARTFPELDGVRYAVPGDRSRILADGTLELYGRDSVTINSGGEKIFAEEVEQAISAHPGVIDVVVCGRPSERWGNEVVAIVKLTEGASATEDELLTEAAKHVARYKLPKAIVWRDEIVRSPAGKADYRWAKAQATEG